MENTLWTLELNHSATIVRLCCAGAMRRRLMDLGFTEGCWKIAEWPPILSAVL